MGTAAPNTFRRFQVWPKDFSASVRQVEGCGRPAVRGGSSDVRHKAARLHHAAYEVGSILFRSMSLGKINDLVGDGLLDNVPQYLFADQVGVAFASLRKGNDLVGDGVLDILG